MVLDVDVFRGVGGSASTISSATAVVGTAILPPWKSGWSGDVERLRTEIRDVERLDRVPLVLRERLSQEKRTGTIRGSDYWVAVRFLESTTQKTELEVRLVRDEDAETGGGLHHSARVSAELNRTLVVRGGSEDEPLFAALTLKDPLALPRVRGSWPPQPLRPIRPSYPEPARRTTRSGTIMVRALIDSDGSLVEPFVLRSLHPDLDAAALEALRNARFKPATVEGKPVSAMITLGCEFHTTSR
jgi:TonB family protein